MVGNKTPEEIRGGLVSLGKADILCHWSDREFTRQLSVELRDIKYRGVNPVAVACSYFLYRNTSQAPHRMPRVLSQLGLGGRNCYTIKHQASLGASIYLRDAEESSGPREVVVVVGCGGSIVFDGREAIQVENAEAVGGKAHSKRSTYKRR